MRLLRLIVIAALPLGLAACGAGGNGADRDGKAYATPEEIAAVKYRAPGPAKLTLMTMVSNETGRGGHTALMINGSERVIWDPAGTVNQKRFIPEKNDVLYGITPGVLDFYTRAHARTTWHVVIQEVAVPPEVAERALRLVEARGAVGNAQCALSTSDILNDLPGFEYISQTWFPVNLSEQFGRYPGVTRRALYEYDDDDKTKALAEWDPERFRAQLQNQ